MKPINGINGAICAVTAVLLLAIIFFGSKNIYWAAGAALFFFILALALFFLVVQRNRVAEKQFENLLNDRTSGLKRAILRLEALISNYKGIIWSVDSEGIITTFNGQYLRVIGMEPSFLEGKKLENARHKSGHIDIVENVEKTQIGRASCRERV